MADTVCCRLVDYLEELTEEEFKKFKIHLEEYPLDKGYKPIRRSKTENADQIEIARLMVRAYEEAMALQMTVNILDRINKKDVSAKIRREMPARFFQPAKPKPLTKKEKQKQEEKMMSAMHDRFFGTSQKESKRGQHLDGRPSRKALQKKAVANDSSSTSLLP